MQPAMLLRSLKEVLLLYPLSPQYRYHAAKTKCRTLNKGSTS